MVTRRLIMTPLRPIRFSPPGVEPVTFRRALAEDVVDLIAQMSQVDGGVAVLGADRGLAAELVWPQTIVFELAALSMPALLEAASQAHYDQVAVVSADAPDVPAMILAKLLQQLPRRDVTAAPASTGGLLGIAVRLPAPDWLDGIDLDSDLAEVRAGAPHAGAVGITPGWHRVTGPAGLARLNPAVEGWAATRALLSGSAWRQ
jgi:hypothetical protein